MLDPLEYVKEPRYPFVPHYHGDTVQILFLIGGVVILATLPFFKNLLPIGPGANTVLVVLIILGAAVINPFQKWIVAVNLLIATLAVLLFEYVAIVGYGTDPFLLSAIRQILAVIFLFSLYYSARTLRAMFLHQIGKKNGSNYNTES
jgi:hypothetical protein